MFVPLNVSCRRVVTVRDVEPRGRDRHLHAGSPDGHERVALSPKGYEAYRKLVQWINEVVRGGV